MQRLRSLDQRVGGVRRDNEPRRDYLARLHNGRVAVYVPREVYGELVELHDKVAKLEATVAQLQKQARASD